MGMCLVCGAVTVAKKGHICKGEPKEETLSIEDLQKKVGVLEANATP